MKADNGNKTEQMNLFSSANSDSTSNKKFTPSITLLVGFISIVLFVGINLEKTSENWDIYMKWGAPSAMDIYNGSYWGLITTNFLHTEIWHIGFNLFWIYIFGKKIEFESTKVHYIFLIISSAMISSFAQLGFADTTGIGLSGIAYAFFGFILIKGRITEEYRGFLEKKVIILFLVWLILCVFLTHFGIFKIGNAAHFAGFIWGMACAYFSKFKLPIQFALGGVLFGLIATSFWWNPLSTTWLSYQAFKLHENQQRDEAIVVYQEILRRDATNEFAAINLAELEKNKLYEKAYQFHKERDFINARKTYNEILKLDPDDKWVKENLGRLPAE